MRLLRLIPLALSRRIVPAVAGVGAVAGVANATPADDHVPGEAAVFARFSDLDDPATQAKLDAIYKEPRLSASLWVVSTALADPTASPDEFEGRLRELLGRGLRAETDRTLAAIMLDHYLGHVRAGLVDRSLRPADVFDVMIQRDALLTAAAYGPSATGRQITRR